MIGRQREQEELLRRYRREKPEFVAIYGRRRVGKTTLVAETFKGKFAFRHAGLSPIEQRGRGTMAEQLRHFQHSLQSWGLRDAPRPESWLDAFYLLERLLEQKDDGSRQVIFIDELPWMDTPRSGFVTALEGFWNGWACYRSNVMLIVCGSASSWILDRLINDHGGLYGRVTCEIRLAPFTLRECEQLLGENGVHFSRYDIVQSYMVFGGVPFYMDALDGSLSLAQNIDQLFFANTASLRDEYDRLFASAFSNPRTMKDIVSLLYTRRGGHTRKEIGAAINLSGGALTSSLKALIASDFIEKYVPFSLGRRDARYRLKDPFCLFYLHFVANQRKADGQWWSHNQATQQVVSWRGLAFENVCFCHVPQIKQALGISGVRTSQSSWDLRDADGGAQIDLLIERDDNVVNACEIKFYGDEFTVDKSYYRTLLRRQELLMEHLSPKMAVHQTLISTFGLHHNEYSGVFTQVVAMDDLFS